MFFESLNLTSFGPFSNFQLRLTPGLNVIYGLNEAGKSSCHAAAYAALCGLRRGRGRSRQESEFEEQYRPWEGKEWRLSAVIQLADQRRVELHQDLLARISGEATDLALGRNLAAEVINEGMIDASRWLGLNRDIFLTTACIRQTEILAVIEQPRLLVEHLQRTLASGNGAESTVAALALIEETRRQAIGPDRVNSPRPLGRARTELARYQSELEQARVEHQQYLVLVAKAEQLNQEATQLEAKLSEQRNRHAWHAFEQEQQRLAEAERRLADATMTSSFNLPSNEIEGSSMAPSLLLLLGAGLSGVITLWLALTGHQVASALVAGLAGLLTSGGLFLFLQTREKRTRQKNLSHRVELRAEETQQKQQLALEELRQQLQLKTPQAPKPSDLEQNTPSSTELKALEQRLAETQRQASEAKGAADSLASRAANIPLAEENLERCQAELERVQELDEVLKLTHEFLKESQEAINRDIAPPLANTLKSWLPQITSSRYTDAFIDPGSLEVKVCGANRKLRKASLLSKGTQEQIYLLLRLALVEHLTREGESAPLLLDEITAASDYSRRQAVLELIKQCTPAHQVLLFTQEVEIARWAEEHLKEPNDQLIRLADPVPE